MTHRTNRTLQHLAAPVVFAAYPVAALYAHNFHEVDLPDLLLPIGVIFISIAILFCVGLLLLRDVSKSSTAVTAFLLFSFAYSGAIDGTRSVAASFGAAHLVTNKLFFGTWALSFLGWGIWIWKTRRDLSLTLRLLGIAGALLLLFSLLRIGAFAMEEKPDAQAASTEDESGPPFLLSLPDPAPDVYYLLFDRYGSASTLEESFGFDNTPFTDSLRALGFTVDDAAITNYPMTHTSLASSLNMSYLGEEYLGPIHYARMIENHAVGQIFAASGYRYFHVASWYEASAKSASADEIYRYAFFPSEFARTLAQTTPYHLFLPVDEAYRQVRHSLDHVEQLVTKRGPKFVFAHVICPHPPYVVRADGTYLPGTAAAARTERENYLDQVQYLNARLLRLIDLLLHQSKIPPIIVIQADEGPLVFAEEGVRPESEVWRRRAGILNAYYLPGKSSELPAGITPVNTFRFLFSEYFGAPIELLENRLYFWPDTAQNGKPEEPRRPFPFVDITDRYWEAWSAHTRSAPDTTSAVSDFH